MGANVRSLAAAAGLLIPLVSAVAAYAEHAGLYKYTVLRNGTPIGTNRVMATPSADGQGFELAFDTDLKVKFGPFTVFRYAHQRRELWRDGRLVRAAGTTNDNGTLYDIEIKAEGGGYVRVVNDRVEALAPGRQPLALWDKTSLNGHTAYFSASEDKLLNVFFEFGGTQRATWLGSNLTVDHYKMIGDAERELWYDMDGHLVRTKFRRHRSIIELRLNR